VANVLFITQFPDVKADARAGKRTLVVRLGVQRARWGYVWIAALAHGWLLACVAAGLLPHTALLGLVSIVPALAAYRAFAPNVAQPARLVPAIRLTILAALLHGGALAAGLIAAR